MRKLYLLLSLAFLTQFIVAQANYSSIQEIVSKRIKECSGKENGRYAKTVFTNFEKSAKANDNNIKLRHIGIAIVLQNGSAPEIYPAKYSAADGKVSITAIRGTSESAKNDMNEYVNTYLNNMENLASSKVAKSIIMSRDKGIGTLTENDTEYIVNESSSLSFVRGDNDWMYAISIDKRYKDMSAPPVILYAYKLTMSGPDIFGESNTLERMEQRRLERIAKEQDEREQYPLYHDYRTDDIRSGLAKLVRYEPYKSDTELAKQISRINRKITRHNISSFVNEFKYLLTLDIPEEFADEYFSDVRSNEDVLNIKHLACHALADYYLSVKEYDTAIDYYKKSVFEYPIVVPSGTVATKDVERCIYDIAKTLHKAGRKDEAYAYFLALMIDSQNYFRSIGTTLTEYLNNDNVDKKKFKADLDKALKTIKAGEKYTYTIDFRGYKAFFYPMMPLHATSYTKKVQECEFYKNLSE